MSGEMTEFRITSDLSALRGQVIEANFAEVREWLNTNLAPYRDMAVTQDTISTAKAYRASIRKVRDRIDESRKEAKAAALAAYSAFETKCKELTGLCDEAANAIDTQVKAIEQAERDAKIAEIRAAYGELAVGELADFCPWARVYNPKWENKGVTADAAVQEIARAMADATNDLKAVRQLGGDDTAYLLDVYKQTHDLSVVVRKASELKVMREREETRKRYAAERTEQAAAALEQAGKAAHAPVIEQKTPSTEYTNAAIGVDNSNIFTIDIRFWVTRQQLNKLKQFLSSNEIRYGRPDLS